MLVCGLYGTAGTVSAQIPDPPSLPPPIEVCPEGRVVALEIENGSIFDLSETEGARFQWAFRLANRLHIETSPRFIRRELLLRVGECWDPLRVSESERLLRDYRFIATAEVEDERRPDGDWTLRVRTRDEWSTKPQATFKMEDGFGIERATFVEENLAGRGILAGVFLEDRREQRDYGMFYEAPQTFGTRVDTGLRAGRTRVGNLFEQSIQYPFLGEVGRMAVRERFFRRDSYFAYRMGDDDRGREVLVPIREENAELTAAVRLGVPGNLTLLGLGVSRERIDFPGYPGSVELVAEGGYDDPVAAPDDLVDEVARQEQPRSTSRANFLLGQRSVRYVPIRGLDALDGVQDVPLGIDVGVMLARSLGFLQVADPSTVDDLFARVNLFAGAAGRSWVFNSSLQLEGRQVYGGEVGNRGWRDVLAEGHMFLYGKPSWAPSHTLLLRASGVGGWTVDTPYQLTLGGRGALRGYPEGMDPGGRRLVISLEDRIRIHSPVQRFMDTGATVFIDAGMMVPGDVPFGVRSGLKASAGAGLRIGFPAGSGGVVRVDLAFPLEGGGSPVFRVAVREILGLTAGFLDEEVHRSRRAGVSQDFPGLGR